MMAATATFRSGGVTGCPASLDTSSQNASVRLICIAHPPGRVSRPAIIA
jgi:hypothetical protein